MTSSAAPRSWLGLGPPRLPVVLQTEAAECGLACLAMAARDDYPVVWLDVWEKNPRAIAFYEKWGFKIVGEQSFQLGADLQHDWLMSRSLGETR